MQWFGTTYTRRFNNQNLKKGHLFQGRYKSILVQNDAYLTQLFCYIHRNPSRQQFNLFLGFNSPQLAAIPYRKREELKLRSLLRGSSLARKFLIR